MSMKKRIIIYLASAMICFFSFSGCTKFDDLFNFENISGLEGNSSWGVPIINAKYTIGDVIQRFDSSGYFHVAQDGSLSFVYTMEKEKIIKAIDFLTVKNKIFNSDYIINSNVISNSTSIEHHTAPISFENEFLKIHSASIKSGTIQIIVSNNMTQDYYCTLSTPNIKTATGSNFSITFTPSQLNHTIDLTNYTLFPNSDNTGIFEVEVGVHNNGSPPTNPTNDLSISIVLTNVVIKSVYAQISPYSMPFNETIDFDLSSSNYGGNLTIYNPKLSISTLNSFMIRGNIKIDTAAFSGVGLYSSIISQSPVNINIPVSPNNYQTENVDAFSSITLNTSYNNITLKGVAVLNPDGFDAGVIRIDENSEISLKLKAEIPIQTKITNLFYQDTLDFKLADILQDIPMTDFQFIDTLALRAYFESTLPLNAYAQVYFIDSVSQTAIDSLFSNSKLLYGSFSGTSTPTPAQMFQITGDRIDQLNKCNKLVFRFKMDTENREVIFKVNQYLKASLGLKAVFNYNNITLNP